MAEQIPSGQEPQPSAEDVVVFSPELLKLAKQRQEHLEECRQAADSGDCAAAVQMGVNYLYGTGGVQKDPEQAFYWFSQSAPDDPVGLYWQAVCYDSGTGVEADEHRAFALFQESADMGYAPAMCDLGVCYENGQGTEKDMDKAVALYKKAAEMGYPQGRCNLGALYYAGVGVEQDYEKAAHYFTLAAEQQLPRAQYFLGLCYEFGNGVDTLPW